MVVSLPSTEEAEDKSTDRDANPTACTSAERQEIPVATPKPRPPRQWRQQHRICSPEREWEDDTRPIRAAIRREGEETPVRDVWGESQQPEPGQHTEI